MKANACLVAGSPGAAEGAPSLDAFLRRHRCSTRWRPTARATSAGAKLPPMTHLVRHGGDGAKICRLSRGYAVRRARGARFCPGSTARSTASPPITGSRLRKCTTRTTADGEKRVALQQDMERKIAEEVENHRLRVGVRLFSYAVFQAPVAVAEMTLSDGVREAQVQVTRDRYSGAIGRPHCHACGRGSRRGCAGSKRPHHVRRLYSSNAPPATRSCAAACGVEPCPVCGMQNCATAARRAGRVATAPARNI